MKTQRVQVAELVETDKSVGTPSHPQPCQRAPVWLRFMLICALLLLATLWLEPHLAPLCNATAAQAGMLLGLAGYSSQVEGDVITLSGFAVRIVSECTPLYACLLFAAFVLARPAALGQTVAGLLLGCSFIMAANLVRIALLTVAGPKVSPFVFEVLHVYLGQVAMLQLVVTSATIWLKWDSQASPLPFLLRFTIAGTVLFLPWLLINRSYVAVLDNLVKLFFSVLYPGYQLLTPRPFSIYNHTFAVPLFLALGMASGSARSRRKPVMIAGGVCMIALWHMLFRVTHIVWTALDVPEILPLHQAIYLFSQFLLPFLLWMLQEASVTGGNVSLAGVGAAANGTCRRLES